MSDRQTERQTVVNDLVRIDPAADVVALANLDQHARDARGAYSTNTDRALRADVVIFTRWCSDKGATSLPAFPEAVAAFVDDMGESKAPATIRRYVSSVATFHRAAKLASPTESTEVKLALKRLHRAKGRAQAQAAGLTRGIVDRILEVPGTGVRSLRNRALLAVAYDTLCRRSELVSLMRADVERGPAGDGTATVRRSKTDQEGVGSVRYLAPDTMGMLDAWLAVIPPGDGFLFRTVTKGGAIGGSIDAGDVAIVFKQMARAAGLSPEEAARISGHSTRVGAATDMVRLGIGLPSVMQAGGWKTAEMVGRYTKRLDARKGGAAKLAALQERA